MGRDAAPAMADNLPHCGTVHAVTELRTGQRLCGNWRKYIHSAFTQSQTASGLQQDEEEPT